MPAATSTASCPAPLIWKKIRLWFLSWISLSSSLRDSTISRYARSRSAGLKPLYERAGDAFPLLTAVAFMSSDYPGFHAPDCEPAPVGRAGPREGHRDDFAEDRHR